MFILLILESLDYSQRTILCTLTFIYQQGILLHKDTTKNDFESSKFETTSPFSPRLNLGRDEHPIDKRRAPFTVKPSADLFMYVYDAFDIRFIYFDELKLVCSSCKFISRIKLQRCTRLCECFSVWGYFERSIFNAGNSKVVSFASEFFWILIISV